jgi:hypothetical protein
MNIPEAPHKPCHTCLSVLIFPSVAATEKYTLFLYSIADDDILQMERVFDSAFLRTSRRFKQKEKRFSCRLAIHDYPSMHCTEIHTANKK